VIQKEKRCTLVVAAVVRGGCNNERYAVTRETRGFLPFSALSETRAFFNFYRRKIDAVTDTKYIAQISDEALEGWIGYMSEALEGEDKVLSRGLFSSL
jgi:hypothetical protein